MSCKALSLDLCTNMREQRSDIAQIAALYFDFCHAYGLQETD